MKIVLISILIFLIVIILLSTTTRYYLSQLITRKVKSTEWLFNHQYNKGLIDRGYYEGLTKEEIVLTSKDGLKLKGVFIEGDRYLNRTMIFVHGITAGIPTSIKYAKLFLDKGWNVLMYDNRRHGESEGKYSTYGYYEKEDLDLFVEWVIRSKGNSEIIGLHGESMGAATVLQYAEINDHVRFIIADCAYSNMNELMRVRIKEDTKFPIFPLLQLADLKTRRLAKFKFDDVSPIDAVKDSDIPVLFIHGKDDKFVPTYMSEKMYEAKKGFKQIYTVEGARHAESIGVNRKKYEKVVFEFVDSVLKK